MRYRFCEFTVDDSTFELRSNGEPVAIEPKALDVLLFLIARRDAVVSSRELLDTIWPDTIVTANALTRAVSQLRRVLHDAPRSPRIIVTVPRRGYRFAAAVTEERVVIPAPPPRAVQHRLSVAAMVACAILSLCISSSGRRQAFEPVVVAHHPAPAVPVVVHLQEEPPRARPAVADKKATSKGSTSAPVKNANLTYRKNLDHRSARTKPVAAARSAKMGNKLFEVGSRGGTVKNPRSGWPLSKKTGAIEQSPAGKFAPVS